MKAGTFQFTPLREGRQHELHNGNADEIFQFTPLREGRLDSAVALSLHADFNSRPSARGDALMCLTWFSDLFQFTPLREGRLIYNPQNIIACYFNSRPSARGDWIGLIRPLRNLFQFTPLREGRLKVKTHIVHTCLFQFTPLREGRPIQAHVTSSRIYFNSRPSARGDCANRLFHLAILISIHAPPRGATTFFFAPFTRISFQFTPLREGRPANYARKMARF